MTFTVSAEPHVPFEALAGADLVVDAVYASGIKGHKGDEPIARLIKGVGNQGGIRPAGSPAKRAVRLAALYTTGTEVDWPDHLDPETGIFTYYGDNRKPGQDLHGTSRGGNILLRDAFAASHGTEEDRLKYVPPFLLFQRAANMGRAVRFRGLLAPGGPSLTPDDELAAIWRTTSGERFQNYRARFTVLDHDRISRAWIEHLLEGGSPIEGDCPPAWASWVNGRAYMPLLAPATTLIRPKADQLPDDREGQAILEAIHGHFQSQEHGFEACAVAIWRLIAPRTGACDITRPSRDGGRDAVGQYILGPPAATITIDFALEAKCYAVSNSVGVREVSRLISRLRHRNFGVLVTTSYFHKQVQEEIHDDGHPIALVCGKDIVDILRQHGHTTVGAVQHWLRQNFPAQ
ncbi:restriction endonuclease [Streptomyces radicis]|uniref:Restriction endonuclease n=1 Tax=Streptomyces radicis TaxID=1750517 RepID=A0A3A9WC04_9ACTN|nr:restriction endonuclease [Streptomyces radicis]RKN10172.1 restriction endonuclease [Streptomyces radicis]RKN24514.1 restriction endonuclease [Streptomyces radicis]